MNGNTCTCGVYIRDELGNKEHVMFNDLFDLD